MKTPGYKTSECWVTVFVTAAAGLQSLCCVDSPWASVAAAVVAGLAGLSYTVSRTLVKLD
jgi:hypothetical protein